MNLEGRHYLTLADYAPEELRALLDLAGRIKSGDERPDLRGQVLLLMFFNPSVRTRISFESAMARLGGYTVVVNPGSDTWQFEHRPGIVMDGRGQEHVKELAPVVSRYADVVGIRKSELMTTASETAAVTDSYEELAKDTFMRAFATHADVPVINCESNVYHPCQGLADAMTMRERLGDPRGKRYALTWAWHPKSLPVATPHSQLLSAALLGMEVSIVHPEGYDLDPDVVAVAERFAGEAGGSVRVQHDPEEGLRDAHVVCAKGWGSLAYYGRFAEEARAKAALRQDWVLNEDRMAVTRDAYFMHCLPVRRNVVVTDGVLDSPRSIVVDEAENRMWAQAAVLSGILGRSRPW
jgi:N-acetylornithine carbamoyltransferase